LEIWFCCSRRVRDQRYLHKDAEIDMKETTERGSPTGKEDIAESLDFRVWKRKRKT